MDDPMMPCLRSATNSGDLGTAKRCKGGLPAEVTSRRKAVAVKRLTMYTEMGEEAVRKTMKVSLALPFNHYALLLYLTVYID